MRHSPRFSTGLAYLLIVPFLTLTFAARGVAQDQPPATAAKPSEQVFPSAVPGPATPEPPQTGPSQTGPSQTGPAQTDAQTKTSKPDAPTDTSKEADDFGPSPKLGVGDMLEVNVYNVPELTTKSRLGSNGDVYLPLIDYVHLSGLSVEEAQALIEKRLSDGGFVKNPHVTLNVDQSISQSASVLGEVAKPGVYPIIGEPRLLDVISAAGGFTSRSGQTISIAHRNQPDKPVTIPLSRNLTDNPANNITVAPGDTILVHRAEVVYAVGEVGRPSGFLMDTDTLTVLKVIALAGGTTRFAKMNGVRIIRKGRDGMTETPIDLKKMLQAKVADMPMQADDILFVPSSAAKVVMGRTADVAVQAANAATIVAIR